MSWGMMNILEAERLCQLNLLKQLSNWWYYMTIAVSLQSRNRSIHFVIVPMYLTDNSYSIIVHSSELPGGELVSTTWNNGYISNNQLGIEFPSFTIRYLFSLFHYFFWRHSKKHNDLMASKKVQLIERIQKVGEGGFGTVYLGKYGGQSEVAIKEIQGNLSAEAREEANVLKRLRHRNIIRYIDIIQERTLTCLVMEYVDGGSLYDYINRTAQSSAYWKATLKMMTDVAHGMFYLHGERIVHADLKSLNVLLRHNYDAVICDFGLASAIVDSKTVVTCNAVGTEAWFAPELCFDPPERSSFASDVWAFGCILLEIISQKIPWRDHYVNNQGLIRALGKPDNAIIFQNMCLTQKAPERLRAILCKCCAWRKADRPNFTTITNDLSAIFDTDLQNITQGTEKMLPSDSKKKKPSASKAQSSAAAATSSAPSYTKELFSDFDDGTLSLDQLTFGPSPSQRKPSTKQRTTQSDGPSTNKDKKTYDSVNKRDIYEGPRGGRYYYSSNGTKVYMKDD